MELTGILCIYLYSSLKADRDLEAENAPSLESSGRHPRHMHVFNFMQMSCLAEPNETEQLCKSRHPGLFAAILPS